MDGYRVIATKSTVPVGAGAWLRQHIHESSAAPVKFDVVSNSSCLALL
jgi:UDP-glucose 6-dehydrogenase